MFLGNLVEIWFVDELLYILFKELLVCWDGR